MYVSIDMCISLNYVYIIELCIYLCNIYIYIYIYLSIYLCVYIRTLQDTNRLVKTGTVLFGWSKWWWWGGGGEGNDIATAVIRILTEMVKDYPDDVDIIA